jgi:hypothetical protein
MIPKPETSLPGFGTGIFLAHIGAWCDTSLENHHESSPQLSDASNTTPNKATKHSVSSPSSNMVPNENTRGSKTESQDDFHGLDDRHSRHSAIMQNWLVETREEGFWVRVDVTWEVLSECSSYAFVVDSSLELPGNIGMHVESFSTVERAKI